MLESDAERWGIGELQKELEALLEDIRPLVERLPAGVLRAVATQRILEGIPCGIISRRMPFQPLLCVPAAGQPVTGSARWRKPGWG